MLLLSKKERIRLWANVGETDLIYQHAACIWDLKLDEKFFKKACIVSVYQSLETAGTEISVYSILI